MALTSLSSKYVFFFMIQPCPQFIETGKHNGSGPRIARRSDDLVRNSPQKVGSGLGKCMTFLAAS